MRIPAALRMGYGGAMIKEWYSAQELAEFKLFNLPETESGAIRKAKKENWTWRARSGNGGGREYHISNLPAAAYTQLIEKLVAEQNLYTMGRVADRYQMRREKGQRLTEADRTTARVAILTLYDEFKRVNNYSFKDADDQFEIFYHSESLKPEAEVIPAWIMECYPSLSARKLRRWRDYKKKGDLKIKWGNRKGQSILDLAEDGAVKDTIIAFITKKTHATAGHVRDYLRAVYGEQIKVINPSGNVSLRPLPHVDTIGRWIGEWKKNNNGLYLNLTDPDGYKNKYQAAFGRADAMVNGLNDVWEIDASPADVMLKDGRHNIYAVIDVYSRRAMYYVTKTPRTEATLLLLRRAIIAWGVPSVLKTDNGSDFTSHRFQNALHALGIEQKTCAPYTPEGKGIVERVIKTLQHDLMPMLPGFIGHNVADRKKIENTKSFSKRLGENEAEKFDVDLTAAELQDLIDRWAMDRYGERVHKTIKETPNARARGWVGSVAKIENERALDILLAPIAGGRGYRQVNKSGVRVEGTEFASPTLALYIGKTVFVRCHPEDMGRIYVFEEDTLTFICEAVNVQRMGFERKEFSRQSKNMQKEMHREERARTKAAQRKINHDAVIESMIKNKAQESVNVVDFRATTRHESAGLAAAQDAIAAMTPKEPSALTPAQEVIKSEIVARNNIAATPYITDKAARITRAESLERRLLDGEFISEKDENWLKNYQTNPEFVAHKKIKESFGSAWFEEKGV